MLVALAEKVARRDFVVHCDKIAFEEMAGLDSLPADRAGNRRSCFAVHCTAAIEDSKRLSHDCTETPSVENLGEMKLVSTEGLWNNVGECRDAVVVHVEAGHAGHWLSFRA